MPDSAPYMDSGNVQVVDHRALPRGSHTVERWTEDEKQTALAIYAECASVATASRETGIPKSTINGWLTEEDVDATLDRLRLAVRHSIAHKLVLVSELALNQVIDSLRNGNEVLDRFGHIRRVKMSGKDAAFVASIAVDKHALITGSMQRQATASEQLQGIADRLLAAMQAAGDATKPPAPPADDSPVLG